MKLILDNVTKRFGKITPVNKISTELNKGKIYGLLGNNGSGKTTLLKILSGCYTNWTGTITYGEFNLKTDLKKIQYITGYLAESNPLYNHMFVEEYLQYIGKFYNINKIEIHQKIKLFGLEEKRYSKIQILSKGYRQRIGLAACFLHNPNLLLLDEPTNGLDSDQLERFKQIILEYKTNSIIVFTSHLSQEVSNLCDHLLVMENGKLTIDQKAENQLISHVFQSFYL